MTTTTGYILLAITVLAGVGGNLSAKLSNGFANRTYTLLTFACYAVVTYLLTLTFRHGDVGVIYAIWTGAGIAVVAILGMLIFHESRSWPKLAFILLIMLGVFLLNRAG